MIGSPRQVRWATSVRDEKMRVIGPELDAMAARATEADAERVDIVRRELASKSATWWLDRRNDEPLMLLNTAARDSAWHRRSSDER